MSATESAAQQMPESARTGEAKSSCLIASAAAADLFHDFRDTGNPDVKVYPASDWRSWERRARTGERE